MSLTPREIKFERDGLYVVLSEQSQPGAWHWGLYLHTTKTGGWIFHIRNYRNDPTWFFEHKRSESIVFSFNIVVALRIAIITPEEMHGELQNFIGTTESGISMADPNQFGQLTCRTWVLQALYQLDQGGHISIIPGYTVRDIEQQALGVAIVNSGTGAPLPSDRVLVDSEFSQA